MWCITLTDLWILKNSCIPGIKLEQIISQFVWKYQKLRIAKAILRKKNETGGINLPDSDYTTKLKSLRQYGTFTKAEI